MDRRGDGDPVHRDRQGALQPLGKYPQGLLPLLIFRPIYSYFMRMYSQEGAFVRLQ